MTLQSYVLEILLLFINDYHIPTPHTDDGEYATNALLLLNGKNSHMKHKNIIIKCIEHKYIHRFIVHPTAKKKFIHSNMFILILKINSLQRLSTIILILK